MLGNGSHNRMRQLLNIKQAISLLISILMVFIGMVTLAFVQIANSDDTTSNFLMAVSSGVMIVGGSYNIAIVIGSIPDPMLFAFYSRVRRLAKDKIDADEMSVFMVLGSMVPLVVSFVAFMYADTMQEAITYAFISSALMPVVGMNTRIYMRLVNYRKHFTLPQNTHEPEDEKDEFYKRNVR